MMRVSTMRSVSRANNFKFFRFLSIPSLAHFTPYFSDSDSDSNSTNHDFCGNKTSLEINSSAVVQILQNLKMEPSFAFSFFTQLKENGFHHDTLTYLAMIKLLCYWGMRIKLESLFIEVITISKGENFCFDVELLRAMIEEVKSKGPGSLGRAFDALIKSYVALEMFDTAIKTLFEAIIYGVGSCFFSCNFLMNRLVEHEKFDKAIGVYEELKKIGLRPNVHTYGIVVRAYCRKGELEEALEVFGEMEDVGVVPSAFTCAPFIEGLCRDGSSEEARRCLQYWKDRDVPLDTYAYNVVIRGFVREKKLKDAEKLFLDMEEKYGVIPDKDSYHALILGYCNYGDNCKALAIHDEMEGKGMRTNALILTPILQCLCLKGFYSLVVDMFNMYKMRGVVLDKVIYIVSIDALCKMGRFDEAEGLFDEMKLRNIMPDIVHYTTLLNGHCLNGNISDAMRLFKEMDKNGLASEPIVYNVLACAFYRNKHLDMLFSLPNAMKMKGVTPGSVTHKMIVKGLCFSGRLEEADRYVKNLEEKSSQNYSAVVNGYCESGKANRGYNLYVELLKRGIHISRNSCEKLISCLCLEGEYYRASEVFCTCDEPSKPMYVDLIVALCRYGDMKRARMFFDEMISIGLTLDVVVYTTMLHGYCRVKCVKEGLDLFCDMKERGIIPNIIKPDAICYTVLIGIQCKLKNLGFAVSLFYQSIGQGLQPDVVTYTTLISCCCKLGKKGWASTLMNDMLSRGIQPDSCFEALHRGIMKAKNVQFRR